MVGRRRAREYTERIFWNMCKSPFGKAVKKQTDTNTAEACGDCRKTSIHGTKFLGITVDGAVMLFWKKSFQFVPPRPLINVHNALQKKHFRQPIAQTNRKAERAQRPLCIIISARTHLRNDWFSADILQIVKMLFPCFKRRFLPFWKQPFHKALRQSQNE